VYCHLSTHLEQQSPGIINAIFAFILTTASHEYLQQLSRSVGYGLDPSRKPSRPVVEKQDQYFWEEEEDDKDNETLESLGNTFPDFFPQELLDVLPAAQKSLVLLQVAKPDHPILQPNATQSVIRWFWTEAEVKAAWNGVPSETKTKPADSPSMPLGESENTRYKPELSGFRIFDLEPGSNLDSNTPAQKNYVDSLSLQAFIDAFPESLPSITPTLSHLTSVVLAQLVRHASMLSSTLLNLFLSSSGTLNFRAHLLLLRSYLLLTAPPFKSRLSAALFSDSDTYVADTKAHSLAIRSLRPNPTGKPGEQTQPWAVGLAPALLERETWPPVGADLSFFLRTVIVDSFDKNVLGEGGAVEGKQHVLTEAEWRLGFAIRDLPTGTGREKWLDPLCMVFPLY
jgi:hypothetical protein